MDQQARIRDFPYKLLVFAMYSEMELDYVRRQGNRYLIETRPMCHRFTKSIQEIQRAFRALEHAGYIYNVSVEAGRVRFCLNLPKYLTFNAVSDTMERYVAPTHKETM